MNKSGSILNVETMGFPAVLHVGFGGGGWWVWKLLTGFWSANLLKWEGKNQRRTGLKAKSKNLNFDVLQVRYLSVIYDSNLHSCGFHEVGSSSKIPGPALALHSLLFQGASEPACLYRVQWALEQRRFELCRSIYVHYHTASSVLGWICGYGTGDREGRL